MLLTYESPVQRVKHGMLDAIIASDIHLGSSNCQAKSLCNLLEEIADERTMTARLILNGDLFDSIDFRRLTKSHWKVLSLLRKLSDRIQIIWICGNHDGSADIVSHLLGVTVKEEFVFSSGDSRILVLHGHTYDDWLDAHPILTWLADCVYLLLQKIDSTHKLARLAKKGSKTFVRCAQKIEAGAIEHARRIGCTAVCCGHTHHAVINQSGPVHYFNSGCWTENPATYLTIADGHIELQTLVDCEAAEAEDADAALPAGVG